MFVGLFGGAITLKAQPAPPPEAAPEPAGTRRSLTLRQAIELALFHNRGLAKAGLDREVQRYDLKVAQDEFVPDLNLTSTARYNPVTTRGNEVLTRAGSASLAVTQRVPTGARFGLTWDNAATDRTAANNKVYDSSVFLQLDQPLLRGAGFATNLANLRIARLTEQTNVLEFKRSVITTVTSVVLTYRNLLQAQLQVEVSRTALTRAQEQLRVNRALVASGILPPVEIIQTEADIATREFNLLTAQAARDSARFSLVRVLDVQRETTFVASDDIALPKFALDLETCRQLAFAHRPDYLQTLQGKAISDVIVDVSRNNRLWSLNLNSRYRIAGSEPGYHSALDQAFTRLNEDWNVGLTLQVPFGDLTRQQTYVRARGRAQKAAIDVTEVTENIEIEVRETLRAIDLAQRRVDVSAVARELAERKLEIEKGRLQAGRTSNFAIITFQNDLVTARLNEIAAQISYLNTLTLLEQTLGTTLAAWGIRIEDLDQRPGPARAVPADTSAPNSPRP
ncbi:TolC family protein [Horticoccus sp. 23ND18S-11]|uniref:TolC family protein n=1 Tax=Horticoccus sp. 23ND18S-11 TaxID=3391832 RepID=UPI0039C9A624